MALAGTAAAQKDAAEKVQEGNVNNWIEFYKKQREAAQSDAVEERGTRPGVPVFDHKKRKDEANLEREQGELSRQPAPQPGERSQ